MPVIPQLQAILDRVPKEDQREFADALEKSFPAPRNNTFEEMANAGLVGKAYQPERAKLAEQPTPYGNVELIYQRLQAQYYEACNNVQLLTDLLQRLIGHHPANYSGDASVLKTNSPAPNPSVQPEPNTLAGVAFLIDGLDEQRRIFADRLEALKLHVAK